MTDLQYEEIEMLAKRARTASVRLAQTSDDERNGACALWHKRCAKARLQFLRQTR